ncbi:MAG TPA: haloacid dehalogenase type II [Candidatus Acidoferrales bacterium]
MPSVERPVWFTFDCYGTLIDWEAGMNACFRQILVEKRSQVAVEQFAADWEEIQFQMIQGPYQPYKTILAEALLDTLKKHQLPARSSDGERLVASLPSWKPFPEVNAVLGELKKVGLRLAILSNIDDDLLSQTLEHFTVPFDRLLTAEQARAYKPNEKVFRYALEQLQCQPEQIAHVAFGERYDLLPAQRLGCRTIYINRHSRQLPPSLHPDAEYADLLGLLRYIALRAPRAEPAGN